MPEPAAELAQAQAYDAQGNAIAPEAVGDAVAKGQGFFKKGSKVYARNPNGELVTVSAEDAHKPGYQVLSQSQLQAEYNRKKYGQGAGDIALAGAAGAARGLTLGASDAVLSGLGGDDTRRALQGLREANPIASGVGEVAGAAAPVLLSGGAAGAAEGASLGARAASGAANVVRTAGVAPRAASAIGSIAERGVARGLEALGYEGKTLLGRAAAGALKTAASGATEGAIYGGAQAANDAVLNGDKITAEKIVAGMGHGALFGGGVGGALGAAGPLLGAAASKLKPSKEGLEQLSREQALQSVARGTDIRRIAGKAVGEAAEARLAATADDLRNYTFKSGPLKGERVMLPGRNTEELLERISLAKEEIGAAVGGVKKELSERMAAAGDSPDVGEFLRRVDEQVITPLMKSRSPGAMSKARAVQKELSLLREEFATSAGPKLQGAELDNAAADFLRKHAGYDSLDDFLGGGHVRSSELANVGYDALRKNKGAKIADKAKKMVEDIDLALKDAGESGLTSPGTVYSGRKWTREKLDEFLRNPTSNGIWSTSRNLQQAETFAFDNLSRNRLPVLLEIKQRSGVPVSRLQGDGLLAAEEEILLGSGRQFKVVSNEVVDSADGKLYKVTLEEPAPPGTNKGLTFEELDAYRQRLREVFQPEPSGAGGLPPAPPKSAKYLEKTERILSEYLKEKASATLLKAGENPNTFNELNRQFHSFRQLEQVAGKNAKQSLGNRSISPSDHALGVASFLGAMATGNVGALGAMAYGGAASIANKLLRERGNSFVAYYAQRAAQMDNAIDHVAQALAGRAEKAKTPAFATALQGEKLVESYEKTAGRIRELARPELAAQHVSALIPEVNSLHPQVGSAVSAKLLGIYQQLAAKLPAAHVDTGETLTPLAIKQRVSPQAMRSFMSSVRGALEPESVINDMAKGIVDRDAVAAMKEAHPETFMQLRNKVADYVEQNEEELPFKRRVMLSLTFDFDGDSSLEPQRMAGLQKAAQEASAGVGEQPAGAPQPKRGNPGVSKLGKSFATPAESAFGGK